MKKIIIMACFVFALCTQSYANLTQGSYYTDITEPVSVSEQDLSSMKKGVGTNVSIAYLVAMGDSGAEAIAKKAGIKKIKYIDKKTFSLWFLYTAETFTVYGE